MTDFLTQYRRRRRTGPIAGVTQLPGFSGTSVAGLTAWWKADALALNDNDSVATFTDSSGNGYDLTQGTAGAKPTFKTNQINGLPAVSFDGGDFVLNTSLGYTAAFTIFGVVSYVSGVYPAFIAEYNSTNAGYLALGGDNVSKLAMSRTGQATSSSNLSIGAGFQVFTYKSTGVSGGNVTVYPYRNGTAGSGTLTLGSLSTNTNTMMGASRGGIADFFTGYISEMMFYNSSLADGDRSFVETYLKAKYAIT